MTSSQQPQPSPSERKRPPWFLIIAAIVIVVVGIVIAIFARGGAVEQVSLGDTASALAALGIAL